jgi:uncharacterized membrane protein
MRRTAGGGFDNARDFSRPAERPLTVTRPDHGNRHGIPAGLPTVASMSQIIESIDVDVPVTTAYNQWTQFEQFPDFLEHVDALEQKSDTLTHWKVSVAGQTREFDAKITEQHPDERVAWTSTGGEVDHAGVVTFHKIADDASRVTVQLDWEPDGLLEKIGAATGVGTHLVKDELKHFKQYIEAKGSEDGAWRGNVEA